MTKEQMINIAIGTVNEMRAKHVPRDKGTLAFDALKYEVLGDTLHIFVDESVAPYMPYTNEPWIAARWHGKKNPNEDWWGRFAEEFANRLAAKLRGELR